MISGSPSNNDVVALNRASGLVVVMDTPKGLVIIHNARIAAHANAKTIVGRGIFAGKDIPAGSVVETSPVLIMPMQDLDALKSTLLNHYT